MRARSIKPGICDNELLGTADLLYTVLFERLWMMADREGRLEDRPLRIKAQAFPYREGLDVGPALQWLHENGFIRRYSVAGTGYIQVCKFSEHQSPHVKEASSKIPAPEEPGASPVQAPYKEQPNPALAHLTPSSLTPDSPFSDSGLRTACYAREAEALWPKVREEYPLGLYRESDWMLAERSFRHLVDQGEPPDKLFEAVTLYRAQQLAKQAIGTQFVLSPAKFFGGMHWRGPFPIPLTKADVRLAGNLAVMQDFVENSTQ